MSKKVERQEIHFWEMLILKWFSEKFPLKNQQLSTIIISKSTSASKKVNCQTDGSGWDFKISPCDLLCFKYSWMYIILHSSQISGLCLNEMFQQNTSKFALFYVYENPCSFFLFFIFCNFTFLPYECPMLYRNGR